MSSRQIPPSNVDFRLLGSSADPVILSTEQIDVAHNALVGRDNDIAEIASMMEATGSRLITLTGPGGVGKTRLALAAAQSASHAFADGVVFVPLSRIASDDLVCAAIARALDLHVMGNEPALNRISSHLADKRLLLILDNFEHVVEASARLSQLLYESPRVTALVTSRVRLRLSREREYRVAPLSLPKSDSESGNSPAVQLFLRRMPIHGQELSSPELIDSVVQIVRRLDGIPLAIELAAARTSVLPPAALLQRLEQRLPLLTGGARDLPPRQQTMRDTIAWSYDLLGPSAQQFFRALSVFRGGFSLPAIERLGTAIGLQDHVAVADVLSSLIDHSLVQAASRSAVEPRYTMFETVREFGWERLQALDEAQRLEGIHAAVTLSGAEAAAPELYGASQGMWLDALEADLPNIRAALSWSVDHEPDVALRLSVALLRFWPIRGYLAEGRVWLERALASAEMQPARSESVAAGLVALSWIHYWQGNFHAGAGLASNALASMEVLENFAGKADALRVLGHHLVGQAWQQDPPDMVLLTEAEAAFKAQLAIWQDLEHATGIAMATQNLGFAALNAGRTKEAGQFLEDSVTHLATIGDRWSLALSLTYLANIDMDGKMPRAGMRLAEALTTYAELRDQWKVSATLDSAALWLQSNNRPSEAAILASAAASVLQRCGLTHLRAHTAGARRPLLSAIPGETGDLREPDRQPTLERALSLAIGWMTEFAAPEPERAEPAIPSLTDRELEVLRLLVQGLSDRRIAETLQISPRTVNGHLRRLFKKLNVESRTAAATYALRHGMT